MCQTGSEQVNQSRSKVDTGSCYLFGDWGKEPRVTDPMAAFSILNENGTNLRARLATTENYYSTFFAPEQGNSSLNNSSVADRPAIGPARRPGFRRIAIATGFSVGDGPFNRG